MSHIDAVLMNGEPDAEKRCCFDCRHCKAAVSWWCTSEEARKERGTGIPGEFNCEFWEPCLKYSDLTWWQRYFGNYISI